MHLHGVGGGRLFSDAPVNEQVVEEDRRAAFLDPHRNRTRKGLHVRVAMAVPEAIQLPHVVHLVRLHENSMQGELAEGEATQHVGLHALNVYAE